MTYVLIFANALIKTAGVIALAYVLLTFVTDRAKSVPALCVGVGFLLGRYSVGGGVRYPDTLNDIVAFLGGAASLLLAGAVFRYRSKRKTAV